MGQRSSWLCEVLVSTLVCLNAGKSKLMVFEILRIYYPYKTYMEIIKSFLTISIFLLLFQERCRYHFNYCHIVYIVDENSQGNQISLKSQKWNIPDPR